jgi:ComF family protein
MTLSSALRSAARILLDFALPPRCPGCGTVTAEVDLFCDSCWREVDFMAGGCGTCGIPLEATDAETCGACLAEPPPLDRIRSAVAYGETARSLVLRLKYGRQTALARTMAHYMRRPMGELSEGAVLAPVPLHRRRLWERGFNQAGLIASALGRDGGAEVQPMLLRRTRNTPKLKGMSVSERRRTVQGAFALRDNHDVRGRNIILVDDVYTSGSTASACARLLKRKGAVRVELITWARVVRPTTVG